MRLGVGQPGATGRREYIGEPGDTDSGGDQRGEDVLRRWAGVLFRRGRDQRAGVQRSDAAIALLAAALTLASCGQVAVPPPASLHSCAVIVENDNGAYCDGTLCLAKSAVCDGAG